MFGTLQGENLIAFRARDQHSVDFAHADGAKGFFQFRDTDKQIGYLRGCWRLFFPLRQFPTPHPT
jgi:hypothetical protein